jgi:hypothetical protein
MQEKPIPNEFHASLQSPDEYSFRPPVDVSLVSEIESRAPSMSPAKIAVLAAQAGDLAAQGAPNEAIAEHRRQVAIEAELELIRQALEEAEAIERVRDYWLNHRSGF